MVCRLCFLRAVPFISLLCLFVYSHFYYTKLRKDHYKTKKNKVLFNLSMLIVIKAFQFGFIIISLVVSPLLSDLFDLALTFPH